MKKLFATVALAACVILGSAAQALASDWKPAGPIKLIIAFAAGGAADTQARMIAEELEARYGWKVIPQQQTGQGGLQATNKLKSEPNDGTAIAMMVTETLGYTMVAAKGSGLALSDFMPIATTAGFQMGIVARPEKGWRTFADVIKAAKSGEAIRFGVMSAYLADLAYVLGRENGIEFNIVSVRGGKEVLDGVIAGDLDIGFAAGVQSKAVEAGQLVNLASALSRPLTQTPAAPMLKDFGLAFDTDGYFIFVGPAGMPAEARDALASAIEAIVTDTSGKAGGFIAKAFGSATVLKGEKLDAFMHSRVDGAQRLLESASK